MGRALLTWLASGSAGPVASLVALLSIMVTICGVISRMFYRRYTGVLGASTSKLVLERQRYRALRESLAGGSLAVRLYTEGLTRFLKRVDVFFGDAKMADQTLFPHAFGLKRPAPLWTAPSLDRCLLLAVLYPAASVFVIWAISGHVGAAETALHLKPDLPGWQRGLSAAGVLTSIFAWHLGRHRLFTKTVLGLAGVAISGFGGITAAVFAIVFGMVPSRAQSNEVPMRGVSLVFGIAAAIVAAAPVAAVADVTAGAVVAVVAVLSMGIILLALRIEARRDPGSILVGPAIFAFGVSGVVLAGSIVGAIVGAVVAGGAGAGAGTSVGAAAVAAAAIVVIATQEIVVRGRQGLRLTLLICLLAVFCLSAASLVPPQDLGTGWSYAAISCFLDGGQHTI